MSLATQRVAILGAGNIGGAIALGLVEAKLVAPSSIILTRRKPAGLDRFASPGFVTTTSNSEAMRNADLIILAVTPQQLNGLLEEIRNELDARRHIVVSIVSGATIAEIRSLLSVQVPVIRAMPNTAIAIRESMTCLSADPADGAALEIVSALFR